MVFLQKAATASLERVWKSEDHDYEPETHNCSKRDEQIQVAHKVVTKVLFILHVRDQMLLKETVKRGKKQKRCKFESFLHY